MDMSALTSTTNFRNKYFSDYRNNDLKGTSAIDIVLAEDSSIEPKRYAKCYSVNLHLTDNEDREIWPTDHPDLYYKFYFKLQLWDVFSPWIESQVYFSIQNSFVPLNPLQEGESLQPGYFYSLQVRLRYREDSSTFEIPYFVAKIAIFVAKMVAKVAIFVAKMVAKVRGSDVATVGNLILTPVKLCSQP
ncbi:hypothetical protein AVEN_142045-1 [Araneus ventricosus]|uniref:Uncharacterized protein n=1 Tax=Araneus ventricosus TaxID=182803 RepID=A0A4Y2K0T4_ARAVE|nr:hypothetical protein AVEN_142045-1 [Araneus ventricosus]